jgi:hypothetical protein
VQIEGSWKTLLGKGQLDSATDSTASRRPGRWESNTAGDSSASIVHARTRGSTTSKWHDRLDKKWSAKCGRTVFYTFVVTVGHLVVEVDRSARSSTGIIVPEQRVPREQASTSSSHRFLGMVRTTGGVLVTNEGEGERARVISSKNC